MSIALPSQPNSSRSVGSRSGPENRVLSNSLEAAFYDIFSKKPEGEHELVTGEFNEALQCASTKGLLRANNPNGLLQTTVEKQKKMKISNFGI